MFAVLALVVEFIVLVPAVSVLPVHEVEYIARHAVGFSAWFLWPTAAAGSVQLLPLARATTSRPVCQRSSLSRVSRGARDAGADFSCSRGAGCGRCRIQPRGLRWHFNWHVRKRACQTLGLCNDEQASVILVALWSLCSLRQMGCPPLLSEFENLF